MCGVSGYYSLGEAVKLPLEMMVSWALLSARGKDACGALWSVGTEERGLHAYRKAMPSFDCSVDAWAEIASSPVRWAALHARAATKGEPANMLNNHPVRYGNVLVTHNGVISNDGKVFEKLKLPRHGEVDTEAIAACLHAGGLKTLLSTIKGSMAIVWADVREPDTLQLYTNGQPLYVSSTAEHLVYASGAEYLPIKLLGEETLKLASGTHILLRKSEVTVEDVGTGSTLNTPYRSWGGLGTAWYRCYDLFCRDYIKMGNHLHRYTNYTYDLHRGHTGGTHVAPTL